MAKPTPLQFSVKSNLLISPNMRRITVYGEGIAQYPENAAGNYIKLVFPQEDEQKPCLRTYTISQIDYEQCTMELDFVIHTDGGPASVWADSARPGDTIQIGGPGPGKPISLPADWFLIAGDMTAMPAIRNNLKQLPEDARGYLVLEIISEEDKAALDAITIPAALEVIWIINPEPGDLKKFSDAILQLPWLAGQPSVWIAAELEEVLKARSHIKTQPPIEKGKMYISSYWQHGMTEDRHKVAKKEQL
ncbi:siderophore-interacting protein [uncultured Amphritea sp.]|uniref:siderophore-interacting protein n=1 Tax=uncultured Amphritea sp. TaxID=981605 RepID=UPI00261B4BA1|nr:siderophore-interacting protein [uncultured Amphritea sp.]